MLGVRSERNHLLTDVGGSIGALETRTAVGSSTSRSSLGWTTAMGAAGAKEVRGMKYLLLIYDDEQVWRDMHPEDSGRMMKEYFDYSNWLVEQGWFQGGDALQSIQTATTVRVRDGERLLTDGPFAETKEQLGGYYLIDVPGLDEAIQAAERIPSSRLGSIEIRPVLEYPDPGAESADAATAASG
jgi:hypothetical protein